VALAGGNVDDTVNIAVGGDGIEFAVIGLDGVEQTANGNHAVPRSVGLEITRVRIQDGMGLLEMAEIGDFLPRAIGFDAKDAVAGAGEAVRATSAGEERVELSTEESDIGNAAGEIAEGGAGLAGGKILGDGGDVTAGVHSGNAGSEAAGVRAGAIGESGGLGAFADGGESAASATFGDVEITVGAELEAAGIVEARGEDGDIGGLRAGQSGEAQSQDRKCGESFPCMGTKHDDPPEDYKSAEQGR